MEKTAQLGNNFLGFEGGRACMLYLEQVSELRKTRALNTIDDLTEWIDAADQIDKDVTGPLCGKCVHRMHSAVYGTCKGLTYKERV